MPAPQNAATVKAPGMNSLQVFPQKKKKSERVKAVVVLSSGETQPHVVLVGCRFVC